MKVEVAYTPSPGDQWLVEVELPAGSVVADAIAASGILAAFPALATPDQPIGLFGRPCQRDAVLRAGDRVEFYRPLQVDPKEARRLRARRGS